ncbi:MAG: GAF domain-containing protein [Chloroflexota bacterium]|nr:MAG: GAF domain-containing protein [Chloroflexota bacterium]
MKASDNPGQDVRIQQYLAAVKGLIRGEYDIQIPTGSLDDTGCLGEALMELGQWIRKHGLEMEELQLITVDINAGLTLEDILEKVYAGFRNIIPYNRIGFSLIEENGQVVRAHWARTDLPTMLISKGYQASLAGSSLKLILETRQPRILNDLVAYLKNKPGSETTSLLVEEGIRSSLTCPLITNGKPVGFMFFSSSQPNTYKNLHIDTFQRIAAQLSTIVEKGRLVSELATQKTAIEEQNERLKQLDEQRNTFLGIAAHDLRSPLSSIRLATDVLMESEKWMPDTERENLVEIYIQTVHRQTEHMMTLLNDLLDITQIESGRLSLHTQEISLAEFLSQAASHHDQLASTKGTRVVMGEVAEGMAQADPLRLRQVMDNLISNGVKYSPLGSTVSVSAEKVGKDWMISVKDQGPGITEADRQRLFQNFARLSARPTGGEKSTGLGLAISRRVVEAHGGHIDVESRPGCGATFWFTLPG